jgi:lipopolysaccharide biosynthesis regulator YciM
MFALLFVAVGTGWTLGRRSAIGPVAPAEHCGGNSRGLNYQLDSDEPGTVDVAIGDLAVNSETLETHLALGNLLRRKGEVDRAIRIHQNLLSQSKLPANQAHEAHLELVRDYISAGLLDRAEQLLLERRDETPAQHRASSRYLLEIYQSQRDWQRAVEVAGELLRGEAQSECDGGDAAGQPMAVVLAHYQCELAAEKLAGGDSGPARKLLWEALSGSGHCVRAALMLGELETASGRYREALQVLGKVREQDPDYLVEAITDLRKCHRALGKERGLQESLLENSSTPLVLAIARDMRRNDGVAAAGQFLSARLAQTPSLRGLAELIGLQMGTTEGKARDDLGLLQMLVKRLLIERAGYRCSHCGFTGQRPHWLCPGCRYWGTIKSIGIATQY